MPNKIRPDIELIIYNYIRDYPTHGPRRISNELKAEGITISETGIYNVLKRKGFLKVNQNSRVKAGLFSIDS